MIEQKYIDRFHTRYKINSETGCWEWYQESGKTQIGYGFFRIKGKTFKAHRFSALIHGLDMSGEVIRHKCDNRCCVNPDHLETGSQQDNVDDKMKRNRHRSLKGIEHWRSIFTESQILSIRAEYDSNPYRGAIVALARKYSITTKRISGIIRRRTWKHI